MRIEYNKAMGEKNELDAVVEMLTQWVTAVKMRNAVNYTDINRIGENLALRLLNTAYDHNLKNLNWDQNNYPAVDLGDQKRGIGFQVTASDKWVKIKDTIEKFYAPDGPHKEFPNGLYFFFIKEKTPALRAQGKLKLQKIAPGFDAQRQMLSMKELQMRMEELYSTDRKRFLRVKDLLAEEWGFGTGKINRRQVLEELYRGSKRYLASLRGGGGRFRYLKISDTLLAPTRQSQRKEWLDTPVAVDGKADGFPDNERIPTSVLEAIPQFWQEECRHAMLKGEGGMGKTVSFIRLWEQYTVNDDYNPLLPVPIFIPLNEYNETNESERKGFIQRMIRHFYLEQKTRDLELLDVFREPVKGEKRSVPSVILLLDGLNEVTIERAGMLVELREMIEHWQGVQMLVSSRPDMRSTMGWTDFHLLELKGLEKEQIDEYLGQWGLSPLTKDGDEGEYLLRRLLQNPMMLTIYAASCDVVKEYGDSSQYDFKQGVGTPGELLWNFMEAQVVKYFRHSGLEERQKYFYKFLIKMLLPALGYEMERTRRFQLGGAEVDAMLECYLKRFCRADFLRTFREYQEHTTAWDIDDYKPRLVLEKSSMILNILSGEMYMLVNEGQSYRFLHHNFRDFFATVHILNEVAMGLSREEVAEVLSAGMISFYPRRYMGEIEGEHYCKPSLKYGKSWQIKSNESALLARELEKCRGNFGEPYAYAVANILESWKSVRGELSGLNLSKLDLSKVLLNGTVCSRLYKKTYLATRFDESLVPAKSLFPGGHSNFVNSVVYSPDGQKILSASGDKTIKEWDVESSACLRVYKGYEDDGFRGFVRATYSGDGQKILSAYWDGTIKEWDLASGCCLRTYQGHKKMVPSVVYSIDGQKILSASFDHTIKEWDVVSGFCIRTYKGHKGPVYSAFYSNGGQKIFSVSWDRTIKEWNVVNGSCQRTFQLHATRIKSAVYRSDCQKILLTAKSTEFKEWDLESNTCLRSYQGHNYNVTTAIYSADCKKILSADRAGIIKEWDVYSGTCLRTYQGLRSPVASALYSFDGEKILSACWDGTIKEWDVGSRTCLRIYQGHTESERVISAVYSFDGKKILSACFDNTIKEWDIATGTCLRAYQGHAMSPLSAVYSPDGQKILSVSYDKTIKEWDVATGTCLRTYQGHSDAVFSAIYSADGQKILSTSRDKTIKEWDVTNGKIFQTYKGHNDLVRSAVYSTDGKKIISVSSDQTIKEWDVETGRCLETWDKNNKDKAPLDDYPDFSSNKTFENRLIKIDKIDYDEIKIIDRLTNEILYTLKNIPGLWIQGCSFKNLHPDSKLSDEEKELLRMYGGII